MITINGKPLEGIQFPAGEFVPCVKDTYGFVEVVLKYEDDRDLIKLAMVCDAIRRLQSGVETPVRIHLYIPYFPYGRQDRVCNYGESLSAKVIADFLNSLNLSSVTVLDPHSSVTPALINNCRILSPFNQIASLCEELKITHLVSPDVGAEKKVYEYAKILELPVITASKIRDVATGALKKATVTNTSEISWTKTKKLLVVDDICDGGGTFIMLSQLLRRYHDTAEHYLYVSHGIFSKGKEELLKHYKQVYNYEY